MPGFASHDPPTPADALANQIGMADAPPSWRRHWAAFEAWRKSRGEAIDLWQLQAKAADAFDLPTECQVQLRAAMQQIAADATLNAFAGFWNFLLYELADEIGDNSNLWPLPPQVRGVPIRMIALAAMTAGGQRAIGNAAASGMAESIQRASLAMVGLRVRGIHQRRGEWGMESVTFHRHYVRGEMFRLGRLVFRVSPMPFAVDGVAAIGDRRIEVHIPGEGRLDAAESADAYRQAIALLPPRHDRPICGFTCLSWLLDPALRQLLPAGSNILKFAEPYRIVREGGDTRQAMELIFGDPDLDPASPAAPQQTALQRAISAHARGGGKISSATGFIAWDDAVSHFAKQDACTDGQGG